MATTELIDYRCPDQLGDHRCQLLAGHAAAHARVPAGAATCWRWDGAGRVWADPGDGFGSLTEHQVQWTALGND